MVLISFGGIFVNCDRSSDGLPLRKLLMKFSSSFYYLNSNIIYFFRKTVCMFKHATTLGFDFNDRGASKISLLVS